MPTIVVDPITRVEGHLKLSAEIDANNTVTSARVSGTLFRDFENILVGRAPWDAVHLTQRICGVCPVPHAIAASKAAEASKGFVPNDQALLLRSLIQASDFIQDHILHFYHLNALDYVNGPQMPPWAPGDTSDIRITGTTAQQLIDHYVEALHVRRRGQEMIALLGGKSPHVSAVYPGGVTSTPTASQTASFKAFLAEVRTFVYDRLLPDVDALAAAYPDYFQIGRGPANLLSYGAFDLPGGQALFGRGRLRGTTAGTVDASAIGEHVGHSYYSSASGLSPASGSTVPDPAKSAAYSFLKAPRYQGEVYETGPLARMKVSGRYTGGVSVMDRIKARALEAKLLVESMAVWIDSVVPGKSAYTPTSASLSGVGVGMTEASRGALGHWSSYADSATTRYQIITPTCWNASPRDDAGVSGAMEQALVGVRVADPSQPVELMRVIRSFDPCTGCAVHVIEPERGVERRFVLGAGTRG